MDFHDPTVLIYRIRSDTFWTHLAHVGVVRTQQTELTSKLHVDPQRGEENATMKNIKVDKKYFIELKIAKYLKTAYRPSAFCTSI